MLIIPFFLIEYGNSRKPHEKYSFLCGAAADDTHRFDHEFGPKIEKITKKAMLQKFLSKVLLLHKKLKDQEPIWVPKLIKIKFLNLQFNLVLQ